ncbi:MAG: four helix bundle protein [Anaerolineae bacterium]|nr:four helix bundle protein [Candidatus Roseilinea sp.]MDW8451102.1 four helix bundle protein [Anaerolineae bacterium]
MSEKIRSYRDLRVWQEAVALAVSVYKLTEAFPKSEQYGLTNQMRRAAVSIASNIAEGFGRSAKEFGRFLEVALGSLAELETQSEIALRIACLPEEDSHQLADEMNSLGRQLNSLRQRVARSSRQLATSDQQPATSKRPTTSNR